MARAGRHGTCYGFEPWWPLNARSPVTVLAKQYNFVRYKIKDIETGEIDFDELEALAQKHKPKIILAGFSSFPRELDYEKFAQIGRAHNTVLMADVAHIAGLIAGKALANPFDAGFHVMSTTTHKTLRGPRSGMILSKGIASNPLVALDKTIENLPTLIDRTVFPGVQGGPHMNTILAKAVSFNEALQPEFQTYAKQIISNAKVLAEELMKRGLKLVTNGTDNHLILIDVHTSLGLNGNQAEVALDAAGLTVNKNVIPDDPLPPFKTKWCTAWYTSHYYPWFHRTTHATISRMDSRCVTTVHRYL
jgi:glycine hydroxymethyltransferase